MDQNGATAGDGLLDELIGVRKVGYQILLGHICH